MRRASARVWLVGGLAVISLTGCSPQSIGEMHWVEVAYGRVGLPKTDWAAMRNPTDFAANFDSRDMPPDALYKHVVTVYKQPMTPDRRIGVQLSDTYWIEAWIAPLPEPAITVRQRMDRGDYWVLTRSTYSVSAEDAAPLAAAPSRLIVDFIRPRLAPLNESISEFVVEGVVGSLDRTR